MATMTPIATAGLVLLLVYLVVAVSIAISMAEHGEEDRAFGLAVVWPLKAAAMAWRSVREELKRL